ncbi:heme oxygenase-like protein [Bimuria novae-zelandiae CBS 107.79]|uniref:Heme oxygenase-like protein n=1 Tax=Bimuria novae-zelandiae CBS 107.79 TaxID=1447943 RepID=A0A6A5V3S4_9PLEO|nr:heme oxygenase-like protein [Bimuria novae-zelandiae CBS 107.79]
MGRHANPDIRRAFAEFQDQDTPSKCNKVRCLHCGFVRAKNTTRQIEHLHQCEAYLASPEAQAWHAQNGGDDTTMNAGMPPNSVLSGQQPNPNLQINRRGPNNKRGRDGQQLAPNMNMPPPSTPSLTAHLLALYAQPFTQATQQPFLSHAGCGSLAPGPLSQWLVQDGHYARGFIRFVGQLLAKLRLPQTANSNFHPMYRTMDLLISALNNMRREMQFFEITATKYGLTLNQDPPTPITRALLDLFVSASSSSASLLEGMVVLWGTEHCYRTAWQYASSFSSSLTTPSTDSHIVALHQALIPNWTSPAFSKFIDASRALVDELANITTARDGKEEMMRCEEIFRQICWLEERFWPDVDGMGEVDESARLGPNLGSMGSAMDNGMNGPLQMTPQQMNGPQMNGLPNGMPSGPMNQMSSQMNAQMGSQMNSQMGSHLNQMNSQINNGESSTGNDGRHSFGLPNGTGLESVGQNS